MNTRSKQKRKHLETLLMLC